MKRPKTTTKYLNGQILKLFKTIPESQLTENRQRAVRSVLLEKYAFLKDIQKDTFIELLKDIDYVERKMRYLTEDIQPELKKTLAQESVVQLYLK